MEKYNKHDEINESKCRLNETIETVNSECGKFPEELKKIFEAITNKALFKNNKKDIEIVIEILWKYSGTKNKELILAYLPVLTFTFSVNYNQALSKSIEKFKNGDKSHCERIKKALTEIKSKFKMKVDTSRISDNVEKSNEFYMYTCFFIQTLHAYKRNFILPFLWFERNLGFFQYYLKSNEYMEIINYISGYNLTGSDISISAVLAKKVFGYYTEAVQTLRDKTYERVKNNLANIIACIDETINISKSKDKFPEVKKAIDCYKSQKSNIPFSEPLAKEILIIYRKKIHTLYNKTSGILKPNFPDIIDSVSNNDKKAILGILKTGLNITENEYEEINDSVIGIITGNISANEKDTKSRSKRLYKELKRFLDLHPENRFITFLVQYLYYSDLFYRKKFIKESRFKIHHYFWCDKIQSENLVLTKVEFYDWVTSDYNIMNLFPESILNCNEYMHYFAYQGNSCKEFDEIELKDSILTIEKVDEIRWKGNLIDKKTSCCFNFEKIKFFNLKAKAVNNDINLQDLFNHIITVKPFNLINQTNTDKIYVFLGLGYFLNENSNSNAEKNIKKLANCGLLDLQNFRPTFMNYPINKLMTEIEKTKMEMPRFCKGSSSSYSSITCSSKNISRCNNGIEHFDTNNTNSTRKFERKIDALLIAWKQHIVSKPMILYGARQVGKTYTALSFGKENYKDTVYFNIKDSAEVAAIFEPDLDTKRIIYELSAKSGQNIYPNDTLIIFDEIQDCDNVMNYLSNLGKTGYHIIAIGNFIDIEVKRKRHLFSTEEILSIKIDPLDFEEFLWVLNKKDICESIRNSYKTMSPLLQHDIVTDLYKTYLVVGGMPEAVQKYIETNDFNFVLAAQKNISDVYISDILKHESDYTIKTYESIPKQLQKKNHKFQYNKINGDSHRDRYEESLNWLQRTGIINKCVLVNEGKLPLSAYANNGSFIVYMNDTGLLCSKFGITVNDVANNSNSFEGTQDALVENYVMQSLSANHIQPYYWKFGKSEWIFVIQDKNKDIIPLVCTPQSFVKSKAAEAFISQYDSKYAIKISEKNFELENNVKSIPFYALFCLSV